VTSRSLDLLNMNQGSALPKALQRNAPELERMRTLAESGNDRPVLMLNCNSYTAEAGFPDGEHYRRYLAGLEALVSSLGGRIQWRAPVDGQPVGASTPADEVLAIWYPSHQAYLDLPSQPGGAENYRLRRLCVKAAVIHACPGELIGCASAERHALIHAFFDAVSVGDLPDALLTDDMTGWITTGGTMTKSAYQGVVALLGKMLAEPLRFTIDAITAEEDRAMAEVRSRGRLIDGSEYANTYVFAFRFRGGRIAAVAEHYNALVVQEKLVPLMRQLNADE
jgi:uncharacterized protein